MVELANLAQARLLDSANLAQDSAIYTKIAESIKEIHRICLFKNFVRL
ncbi:hypothetical protein ACWIUD_11355 [Helicobacter sp. 23-1044]